MKKSFLIILLLISVNVFCVDNQHVVDSLLKLLPNTNDDTTRINLLTDIADNYRKFESENAAKYCDKAIDLSKKINNIDKVHQAYIVRALILSRLGENDNAILLFNNIIRNTEKYAYSKGKSYLNLGNIYADLGKYDSSIIFYEKSIVIFDKIGNEKSKAGALNNIGTVHSDLGNFEDAVRYYTVALKIHEAEGNIFAKATSIENIGIIYYFDGNYDKALEYFKRSVKIFRKVGRLDKLANALNNCASMNMLIGGDKETAIKQFKEAEKLFDDMGHKAGQAEIAQNLASIYFQQKNQKDGLVSLNKAIKLYSELGVLKGVGKAYKSLGEYYAEEKLYLKAIPNYLKAQEIWEPLKIKNDLRELYHELANAYFNTQNFKKSAEYYEKYVVINDSIFNRDKSRQIAEMQEKYDSESKQQEIELQQIEIEKEKEKVAYQTKQKIWFGVGLGLTIFLLIIAFRGYKQKQKSNTIITSQKNIVEEKNREIVDSINYAKRIQNALLNSEEQESKHLPEHFVFFNPKDIVSGDFYWTFERQNYLYLAVADCTGHGVPGAFLTMLGTAFLNEITAKEKILLPSEILDELRSKIIKELNQTGAEGENKDGMDMSLIRLDVNTKELEWSGANNPLWVIKNKLEKDNSVLNLSISSNDKHLYEIKSDKQPISYYPDSKPFTNHRINLETGDSIYLFTDGYADQFGGEKGKKFKYKPFKELLISISNNSMLDQKKTLEINFIEWKGDLEQIDDVCVVGVKI